MAMAEGWISDAAKAAIYEMIRVKPDAFLKDGNVPDQIDPQKTKDVVKAIHEAFVAEFGSK